MHHPRRSRPNPAAILISLLVLLPGAARAQPDPIDVHCVVYLDENGDGARQGGEPGFPGVRLTNGLDVVPTDPTGVAEVTVDRAFYRFVTLTIPAGLWPTSSFYHRVPVGSTGPDTVAFGLRPAPETATDPVRWVHVSDTHVNVPGTPWPFSEAIAQINEIPEPPVCIINTGDLVDSGSDTTQWNNYVSQIAASDLPVLHAVGNHDTLGTATPLGLYEEYVGPPYYSVEMGSWHLVFWNSEPGSPRQHEWLVADVAAAAPGAHFVLFQHRLSVEAPDSTTSLWTSLGITDVFSGHWHCYQVGTRPSGITDYNISRTILGPKDRTPRVFNIVTCDATGGITSDLRRLGVDHRAEIVAPPDGHVVRDDVLTVLVQAYDTSARVTSVAASVSSSGRAATSLVAEGVSLWRGTIDLSSDPDGAYTVDVTGVYEDGSPIAISSSFTLAREARLPPSLGADWPMFRGSPAGSSCAAGPLDPPLELRWTSPIPGMVALASPVVAQGKVFLGCRTEFRTEDAGVAAFDALTGQPLWFAPIPAGVALAPAVSNGVVIVTAIADSVYGLDAQTGNRAWAERTFSSRYDFTAPIVEGTTAWVGAESRLAQRDAMTGALHWKSDRLGTQFFPYIYGAPAIGPSSIYLGMFGFSWSAVDYGFVKLDRNDGSLQVWEAWGAWRSPVCTEDAVFVVGGASGSSYDPEQHLSKRTLEGAVLWTAAEELTRETASPALAHDTIVVSGKPLYEQGRIFAFDVADGALAWSFPVGHSLFDMVAGLRRDRSTSSTPAIADSVVYVGSLDGHLYALSLADGSKVWSYYLGAPVASSPAISGDWLFVGASDGHLWAFAKADPDSVTAVRESAPTSAFAFHRPSPNPTAGDVELRWDLPREGHVRLRIYDVRGRLVRTLVDRVLDPGRNAAIWNGEDRSGHRVAAGVYLARLESNGGSSVRKIVRLGR